MNSIDLGVVVGSNRAQSRVRATTTPRSRDTNAYGTWTPCSWTGPSVGSSSACLVDAGRGDRVHHLRHGSRVHRADRLRRRRARRRRTGTAAASARSRAPGRGLNPSWPCSTTVNVQPGAGRAERRRRHARSGWTAVAWFAVTATVPSGAPAASTNTGSAKPCTSIRPTTPSRRRSCSCGCGNGGAVENAAAAGSRTNTSSSCAPSGEPNVGVRSRSWARR